MLNVKNLSFAYQKKNVLKELSFKVNQGEYLAIIGESGCGKSTLLKLIYGEYDLSYGQLFWKNIEILGPKYNLITGYDFIKSVTQEFDLMPFTSVEENIGKFLSNFYPKEKQKRIAELIKVVELEAFAKTKIKLLSGGQKQRVAIARALAKTPEIILLDEPFSHIDNFKKQSLRRNVFAYLKEKKITCIVATHDKNDVLGFADALMVLNNQKMEDYNTPEHIYNYPKTNLIASFFDEFNVIDHKISYASQLKIVNNSNLKALVVKNYFNGGNFLVECKLNGNTCFFYNHIALEKDTTVCLELCKL